MAGPKGSHTIPPKTSNKNCNITYMSKNILLRRLFKADSTQAVYYDEFSEKGSN